MRYHRGLNQLESNFFLFSKIVNCLEITPDKVHLYVKEWKDQEYKICEDFDGFIILELFGFRKE